MTTQALTLQLEPRTVVGKRVRHLRRQGITPVHLYGRDAESLSLQGESAVVLRTVTQAGVNRPISVSVAGHPTPYLTFIREVQKNPLTDLLLHVDFYQVPMAEVTQAEVPVHLMGEAPAIRTLNGVLLQTLNSIRIEALPLDMPQYIEMDISGLDDFEKALRVSDVTVGDKVTVLNEPDEMIARVNAPRVIVEEEVAVAAEEEEAGAEAQPSDEAPASPAAGEER